MGDLSVLAEALRYPAPNRKHHLTQLGLTLAPGVVRNSFERFLAGINNLSLGEWEELHTRTLDLNPPAAPYIGYQSWGDSYQRGSFLSMMSRALETHKINTDGELPDHLIPVMRFLDEVKPEGPEILEVFDKAVFRIYSGLAKLDPDNPYVYLFEAITKVDLQSLSQDIESVENTKTGGD